MSTQTEIPFELYKANLQLALRTNKLLKECGQRWLDTFGHAVGESASQTQQEIDKLSMGEDWAALAAIPGDTFLYLMQQRVGDAQSIAQAAVINQTKFFGGLQDAFMIWQRETANALGGLDGTKTYNTMLGDFFKVFNDAAKSGAGDDH